MYIHCFQCFNSWNLARDLILDQVNDRILDLLRQLVTYLNQWKSEIPGKCVLRENTHGYPIY